MKACGTYRVVSLLVAGVGTMFLMGAAGQPPSTGDQPVRERPRERANEDPAVRQWREKFRDELKEHPRIARSLVELHVTKEHLEKAPHDFGGHRVAAIAAVNEAIKQLHEAMKFDVKQEEKHGGDAPKPTGK